MKTIFLLRHAKSSWDEPGLKDFDRPLAGRGKKDAPRMGAFLREVSLMPDQIVSSPAQRARQTIELFCKQAGLVPQDIIWDENLYYGGARDYLKVIQDTLPEIENIMLVGHNPLLEETVSLLCYEQDGYPVRIPTAGLVCLEHSAMEWEQVRPGTAQIRWMMIPKILKKRSR